MLLYQHLEIRQGQKVDDDKQMYEAEVPSEDEKEKNDRFQFFTKNTDSSSFCGLQTFLAKNCQCEKFKRVKVEFQSKQNALKTTVSIFRPGVTKKKKEKK